MPDQPFIRRSNPKFIVHELWGGQMVVQMNPEFAELLATFIEEIDEVEEPIRAFRNALVNPCGRPIVKRVYQNA